MEPVTDCSICRESVQNTTNDTMCLRCRHKVCGTCFFQLAPLCSFHNCVHFKCPTCREIIDIPIKKVDNIFINSGEDVLVSGNRKLVRIEERLNDEITLVSVEHYVKVVRVF